MTAICYMVSASQLYTAELKAGLSLAEVDLNKAADLSRISVHKLLSTVVGLPASLVVHMLCGDPAECVSSNTPAVCTAQ
jgi:hypothetical protein